MNASKDDLNRSMASVASNRSTRSFVDVMNPRKYMSRRTVSPLAWVTLVCIIITFILFLFTFVSPYWAQTKEIKGFDGVFEGIMYGKYAIWYGCWTLDEDQNFWETIKFTDCELLLDMNFIPSWLRGCQALAVIELIIFICILSFHSIYICSMKYNRNKTLSSLVVGLCITGALVNVPLFVSMCVMFLRQAKWCCFSGAMQIMEYRLHASFIISCVVTGFLFGCAYVALLEMRTLRKSDQMKRYMQRVRSTRKQQPYAPSKSGYSTYY